MVTPTPGQMGVREEKMMSIKLCPAVIVMEETRRLEVPGRSIKVFIENEGWLSPQQPRKKS